MPPEETPRSRRLLVVEAALAGIGAIIPIPFVDDLVVRSVKRRMVRRLARLHGLELPPVRVQQLSGTVPERGLGCLWRATVGFLVKLVVKILRRIFRTLLFWLTVKDATDAFSRTFHEGWLVESALRASGPDVVERAPAVRTALEAVLREIDTRPFERAVKGAFRQSGGLLRRAAAALTRRARTEPEDATATAGADEEWEAVVPGSLVERLLSALPGQQAYLERLERSFQQALAGAGDDARREAGAPRSL